MCRRRTSGRARGAACVAVLVGALALGAGAASTSAAADEAGWMFDPDAIVEIELGGLSPEEIEKLETEKDEYQRGTFELKLDGVAQGPPLAEVGIRLKGGTGSFKLFSEKAAFKVKFNEYVKQKFFGLKKLTLNNMVQDPSMVHETLTYELFRALGLPAPRTGYANVRVNGENFGLHLNVETYDDVSLPGWFASTGHLYEADEPGVDVTVGSQEKFEVDEGDDEDLGDLEALIAAANDEAGDWSDGMAGTADLEQMTRMWAVERYVGHWDGYAGVAFPHDPPFRPNNYYLHSLESGLFAMLPWGTDQTWELDVEFDEPAGGLLFNHCLGDASCKALYVAALNDVHSAVPALELHSHAAELAELLAPCQALEVAPRREYTAKEIGEGVEATRDFVAERPDELATYLGLSLEGPATEPPPDAGSPSDGPCPVPSKQADQAGEKATPPSAASVVSTIPVGRVLLLGRLRARGARVSTVLDVPRAGSAKQRVTAWLDGRRRTACIDRAPSVGVGQLTLSCRLSATARRRLRSQPLRLTVVVRFTPSTGAPETIRRSVVVPRLGQP